MTESRPGAATSFMSHMRHKTGRRNQNLDMSILAGPGLARGRLACLELAVVLR